MKRILLALSALFFISFSILAQGGYEIKIKINDFDQKQLYLGYHYGDKQYINDTVDIDDKGYFTFTDEEPLKGGVYLVIMPPDNQYFQLLVYLASLFLTRYYPVMKWRKNIVPDRMSYNALF